jgi:hypothetical protein
VLPEHGAQGGLREHDGCRKVALHLNNRPLGIDDVEIEHRVDLHRDVVAGDHVLCRYLNDLDAQIHPDHLLKERNQQHQTWPFDALKAPERKDHSPFILAQDLYSCCDHSEGHDHDDRNDKHHCEGHEALQCRRPNNIDPNTRRRQPTGQTALSADTIAGCGPGRPRAVGSDSTQCVLLSAIWRIGEHLGRGRQTASGDDSAD